jgi:hypothetical protein
MINEHMVSIFDRNRPKREFLLISKANTIDFCPINGIHQNK